MAKKQNKFCLLSCTVWILHWQEFVWMSKMCSIQSSLYEAKKKKKKQIIPVQEIESTPGPKYSTMAPVPPLTVRIPATFRMTSLGEVQPLNLPVSFTPITCTTNILFTMSSILSKNYQHHKELRCIKDNAKALQIIVNFGLKAATAFPFFKPCSLNSNAAFSAFFVFRLIFHVIVLTADILK